MNLACPIDNKDDTIQKVSTIVEGGQLSGTYSGSTNDTDSSDVKSGNGSEHMPSSGKSTSQLAIMLAPPQKPKANEAFSCFLTFLAGLMIIAGSFGLYSYVRHFLLLEQFGLLGSVGIIDALQLVIYIAIVWGGFKIISARKLYISKENERVVKETYLGLAMKKWDRLYYCHKHDIVFDPESGESSAPSSLKEFLYK